MSGNSAALTAILACAAFLAGSGWNGAAAQGPSALETRTAVQRAQRELTAAENVLRDARDARVKIESAANERLARIEERRRNANAMTDTAQRRNALRAVDAEEKQARDDIAKARAAEAAAEKNAEDAALALARARSGAKPVAPPAAKAAPPPKPPPPAKPVAKPEPAPAPPPVPTPAAVPAPPPQPAAPPAALDALINARMDVESAEATYARARAARENAERATEDEIRELARLLAEAAELKKRAEGPRAAEAADLEANLKVRIQEATAKPAEAKTREAEAKAALDSARAREEKARAEIEASLPSPKN